MISDKLAGLLQLNPIMEDYQQPNSTFVNQLVKEIKLAVSCGNCTSMVFFKSKMIRHCKTHINCNHCDNKGVLFCYNCEP